MVNIKIFYVSQVYNLLKFSKESVFIILKCKFTKKTQNRQMILPVLYLMKQKRSDFIRHHSEKPVRVSLIAQEYVTG